MSLLPILLLASVLPCDTGGRCALPAHEYVLEADRIEDGFANPNARGEDWMLLVATSPPAFSDGLCHVDVRYDSLHLGIRERGEQTGMKAFPGVSRRYCRGRLRAQGFLTDQESLRDFAQIDRFVRTSSALLSDDSTRIYAERLRRGAFRYFLIMRSDTGHDVDIEFPDVDGLLLKLTVARSRDGLLLTGAEVASE
jgi:hypothetical protein